MPTATPFNNLITFSRGSNATVTGSNGLIQWAPNNILTSSQSFTTSGWVVDGAVVTPSTGVAPDGTTTATGIALGTGNTRVYQFDNSGVLGNKVFSLYVKAGVGSTVAIRAVGGMTPGGLATVNAVTGAVSGLAGASSVSVGSGWYRVSIPVNVGTASGNSTYWTIEGTGGAVFIWGAQLELGSTATTYNSTTVKNLLGFSEAFDNAAWVKSNSSIVTGAQANPVNGLFTAQKLMENTANSVHRFIVGATVTAAPYTMSIYAKAAERNWIAVGNTSVGQLAHFNLSNGTVGTIIGSATAAITNIGSGWYRCSVTFTPAAGAITLAVWLASADNTLTYTGDGNSGVYVYGIQLSDSASLDPYVPTPGAAPSSTAFYGPRFDFDPVTRAPRGILIEEPRTNSLTYSEQFNDPTWTKFLITVTANSTVSPDGTTNADTIASTGGGSSALRQIMSTASGTHTATIYAKAGTKSVIQFSANAFSWGIDARANFDLASGVLGTVDAGLTATITNVGNGWYRCSVAATKAATAGALLWCIVDSPTSAREATTTAGTLFVWAAQLEAGAFATSYIPTVASTVTRSADVALISGQNFGQWYNQSAGSFVVNASSLTLLDVGYILTTSDGTNNNRFGFYRSSANIAGYITNSGVVQMEIAAGSVVANAPFKTAAAATANDGNFSLNGSIAAADTSITMPTLNKVDIANINSSGFFSGHIRSINFIPARAADFQLQALTAQSVVDYFYLQTAAGDQLVAGNDDYLYSLPILG